METYKQPFTDKFPFKYYIESNAYVISTTNEDKFNEALKQIWEKGIMEFTPQQIVKFEMAGFTIRKRL